MLLTPRYPVVLASASPRRQELLRELITEFRVVPAEIDEDALTESDPFRTAKVLARTKAESVHQRFTESWVIGGDTVVALPKNGLSVQFSKPVDEEDAVRMLSELSGQTHIVITGLAFCWPGGQWSSFATSWVTFRSLNLSEIEVYVATGECLDKAGAYAIQAGGGTFIAAVRGSRHNVIGLPTELLVASATMLQLV